MTKERGYSAPYLSRYVNTMEKLFKTGVGSLAYRDRWFLIDQILLSEKFKTGKGLRFTNSGSTKPFFLKKPEQGNTKVIPFGNQDKRKSAFGVFRSFPSIHEF